MVDFHTGDARQFKRDLRGLDTSVVRQAYGMFKDATSFNYAHRPRGLGAILLNQFHLYSDDESSDDSLRPGDSDIESEDESILDY